MQSLISIVVLVYLAANGVREAKADNFINLSPAGASFSHCHIEHQLFSGLKCFDSFGGNELVRINDCNANSGNQNYNWYYDSSLGRWAIKYRNGAKVYVRNDSWLGMGSQAVGFTYELDPTDNSRGRIRLVAPGNTYNGQCVTGNHANRDR
ncbi:hypothetical protein BC936DRAFT_141327 [Jimgerdemannia flammicorona]|uniref:Ricin B lectin domain-containing protein n=1 Tax=Jimgerdemannia flammicorona TaxID=994334 RepID=A0A433DG49_9FUNG|nr:hypothetical protein BC936DRAFT_141327 [Jimgerdemannia flammicorona]